AGRGRPATDVLDAALDLQNRLGLLVRELFEEDILARDKRLDRATGGAIRRRDLAVRHLGRLGHLHSLAAAVIAVAALVHRRPLRLIRSLLLRLSGLGFGPLAAIEAAVIFALRHWWRRLEGWHGLRRSG